MSNPLFQTLAELDAIPALLEAQRERLETTATQARIALERMAVALESEDNASVEYTEPKELKDLKALVIDSDEIQRLRMSDVLFNCLKTRNVLQQCLIPNISDLELVNQLLPWVDPSIKNNEAIRLASRKGHVAVVDRLLQDGTGRVDPSADNNFAIQWASQFGHVAVVDRLLQDSRVDPTAQDNYAIQWASQFGHVAVVERLLQDSRVDPSAPDNQAIRIAHLNGHVAVVELLKAHGCVLP